MTDSRSPKLELTRRGFVTAYPAHRYWRPTSVDELLSDEPLNVYLHTPYCIQRCAYCHYKVFELGDSRREEIDRYIRSVCREIALSAAEFRLADRPVKTIYFGGGTPSLLSEANIRQLLDAIGTNFRVEAPEITFEAEPVTLTSKKARVLADLGINRISVGIQSFSDDIVRQTGRRDTEERAFEAIRLALGTGAIVNIDLLSGLAGETRETWAHTVSRALDTGVHCITMYKMELYANTGYYSAVKEDALGLPDDDLELELAQYAQESLLQHDYLPVTSFTYGLNGRHGLQHIARKWRGEDAYGFGVSAFSSTSAYAFQNTNDPSRYSESIDKELLPIQRAYPLKSIDIMARDLILGIKLMSIDRAQFERRHGVDVVEACRPAIGELLREELINVTDGEIRLTTKGVLYGDAVGRALAGQIQESWSPHRGPRKLESVSGTLD